MKKVFLLSLLCILCLNTSAQTQDTIPITFHFKPSYTEFEILRLVGEFNGWNNADDNLVMSDPDGDGEYEVTKYLPKRDNMYKFVMDADWDFAYTDPSEG